MKYESREEVKQFVEAVKSPEGREAVANAIESIIDNLFNYYNSQAEAPEAPEDFEKFVNDFWQNLIQATKKLQEMPEEEALEIVSKYWGASEGDSAEPRTAEIILQNNLKKPESLLIPTAKVIKLLYDGKTDFTGGLQPVSVGRARGKTNVLVETFVSAAVDESIQLSARLTRYDKQVQNGIFTLIENGYSAFTAKQVYTAFSGKGDATPQAVSQVTRSINKQRTTLITIDWTAHAKMNGLPIDESRGDYVTQEENLLYLTRCRIKLNGAELDGYKVINMPPLLRYVKAVGQLSTIDKKLLDVPVNNTEGNIVLKNELIEQIEAIKKGKLQKVITFERLYEYKQANTKQEKIRVRKDVEAMLNEWKKHGFIKSYTMIKKGREFYSISIQA